jgi:hypothetical protein
VKNILKLTALAIVIVFIFVACSKDAATDITNPGSVTGTNSTTQTTPSNEGSSSTPAQTTTTQDSSSSNTGSTANAGGSSSTSGSSTGTSSSNTGSNTDTTGSTGTSSGTTEAPVDVVEDSDGPVLDTKCSTVAEHVAAGRIKNNHGQIQKYTKRYGTSVFCMYKYNKNVWKDSKKR